MVSGILKVFDTLYSHFGSVLINFVHLFYIILGLGEVKTISGASAEARMG